MNYLPVRKFGQTDKPTSFGLGGAALNNTSYKDGVATVKRALELGVTYFDTSPGYCRNLSQPIVGEGLSAAGGDIMTATKVGYFPTADGFRSPLAIKEQIKDNLRLLGRSSVDVLQVHEANWVGWWEDGVDDPHRDVDISSARDWNNAPVLEVLREAKQEGLCRYIGITGNRAPIMSHILSCVDVDTFLLAYSYDPIIRNAEDSSLRLVAEKGTTLILGAIFYGGRLTAVHPEWIADPPDWMDSVLKERFEKLYAIQRDCGISLVQLCVRFAMEREEPSVVLVGAATPAELEESIQAVHDGPLSSDVHGAIESLGVRGRS